MSNRCQDVVWDYVRPSSSFQNTGTYAPPSTPRVHAFAAVPRTEPADCKTEPPVGGIGTDVCRGRRNPYRGGLGSFHLRFTYLREGGHQVSRSPGPGSYETRHLTGGALVRRPKTASPCFRRSGGRLHFDGGGTWHEETPLKSAERRGTVRASVKTQAQHYSLSFRSKADRLVVNKPTRTTHEGLGPGCYDVSKDGKSVGVKTEKRVGREGCGGRGSTNQFLVNWRAYMTRPPAVNDGYGDCCCAGNGGTRTNHRGEAERSPTPALHSAPKTPQTVSYTLKSQSEPWPAARKQVPVAANRGRKAGGPGSRLREREQTPPQHRHPEEDDEEEEESFFPRQQPQHSSSPLTGRAKRPASAVSSLRIPSATEPQPLSNRHSGLPRRRTIGGGGGDKTGCGSVLGGGSGGGCSGSFAALSTSSAGFSGAPQFVPRPPSVDVVSRPRAACSAASAASQGIDNSADSRCRGDGRRSAGGRDAAEARAPRANIALGNRRPVVEKRSLSGMGSSPGGAAHRAERPPPTAKPTRPENADVAGGGSERRPGVAEDGAPRGASRPAPAFRPQPPVDGTTEQTEDLREEDGSSDKNHSSATGTAVPPDPASGSEPTACVAAATSCADTAHYPDSAGRRVVDAGEEEGVDQATTPSSGGVSPVAPSGRNTRSPPPSRRRSDESARSQSQETRGSCCSPRENSGEETRRAAPPAPSAAIRTSPGTAAVAPTPALASPPSAPEPQPAPHSEAENVNRAPSTHKAGSSSSSSSGGCSKDINDGGENTNSAFWRIQAKNSFSSVLDVIERRSMSSRSPRSGTGSTMSSDGQGAVLSSRPCPATGNPWRSNHGPRKNSNEGLFAGSDEQQQQQQQQRATSLRGERYRSFLPREDSSLKAVPERRRVDPLVARLTAATAEEFVGGALSAAVVIRLSGGAAANGSGGGGVLDSRGPE